MRMTSRVIPLLGCAAGCVLAGCCTTPKSQTACTNCVSTAVMTPIYENYSPPPPVIKPIPMPDVAPPPPVESFDPPPPPQTKAAPNQQVDFFESTGSRAAN